MHGFVQAHFFWILYIWFYGQAKNNKDGIWLDHMETGGDTIPVISGSIGDPLTPIIMDTRFREYDESDVIGLDAGAFCPYVA